ncbi:MAG TPA: ATP-binding protein [Burkholderiales bacterium]|nr:ATP-binding protein [Burkholderiales bacterium]
MKSLKRQLIVLLVGMLAVVGMLAGFISYPLSKKDAGLLLDHQLREVARSIDEGSQLPSMQARFAAESEEERENDFVIQVWYEKEPVRSSRPGFTLSRAPHSGFSYMADNGKKWRAYTLYYPNRTVQVSQSMEVRREIAENAAMRTVLPIAGLIPLSWILVALVIGRILKPLDAVKEAVTQRDASSLDPLPAEHVPEEVAPLIKEMNALLLRLREALESQRQFISYAVHELRTPLAALQLQIENLAFCKSEEDVESRMIELNSGVKRASRLVNQLLKMARFEADKNLTMCVTDPGQIVKNCIGALIPLAEKKGIDLGMIRDEEARVMTNADSLRVLFENLLDNAIRYTPEGGKIDVSVCLSDGKAVIEIADSGPGIPEDLLPRVFDRFFRASGQEIEGSGIGLAIVQAIAERQSAEIRLANREEGTGLIASVSLGLA